MRLRLRELRRTFKRELTTYQLVLKDARTPRAAKLLLSLAVGYALLPFDLIPDFIPVIGHLDDAIIVAGLVWLALRQIPAEVVAECRIQADRETVREAACGSSSSARSQPGRRDSCRAAP